MPKIIFILQSWHLNEGRKKGITYSLKGVPSSQTFDSKYLKLQGTKFCFVVFSSKSSLNPNVKSFFNKNILDFLSFS